MSSFEDETEFKRLRKHIAFDLGLLELSDQARDEETIHTILLEHGIEPDEDS